jgi:hypothetical protein
LNKKWIYDIETYPNVFTFSVIREDGKFANTFEVSAKNNEVDRILKCLDYVAEQQDYLVGFNNLNFDYPVVHKLLKLRDGKMPVKGETIAKRIYGYAQEQIESMKGEFANTVKAEERHCKQIDLFKVHHFDNKARMTSLKMLEFNMRSHNIEDLPFPVGMVLSDEQIVVLKKYNAHDVRMTLDFYNHSVTQVEFREQLTEKYGRDFMNHNDTKIGKDYFIMKLEELKIPVYKIIDGKRRINQTKRDVIRIKDCLFSYYDFKRPEFIAVKDWLAKQIIRETKGVFTDIEEHKLGDVAKYAEMVVKRKKLKAEPTKAEYDAFRREHPCGWVDRVELKAKKKGETQYSYWGCWKVAETLNIVIDGFRFDFGTGGIHGSLTSNLTRQTKAYQIVDADVSSMYPNIAISNNVYPEHLSAKFCAIYKDVYEQRKSYPKGSAENAMLKLALNGVYGDSNNQYSPFFDPAYTMKITINGQLSLCLLAEKLLTIDGLKLIQVNTDGVTVALKRETRKQYDEICEAWQKQVKLQLEFAEYDKMFIRDVNNYIALYTDGKTKNKGAYEYKDLGWHKNHSSLVIPMAAEAKMLQGTDIREFIMNHKDKFDFMLRTKVPRSSRLVLVTQDGQEVTQQNICRYYPCKSGGKLVKIMPPLEEGGDERRLSIDADWFVKPCNNMDDFVGDIDYDYYVAESEKLIIQP